VRTDSGRSARARAGDAARGGIGMTGSTMSKGLCTCPEPIVVIRAERKGAPMRVCGRCGLGLKVTF